ncbi:hypothetical protein QFZ85_000449 [Pseudomonas frederiksbergensis]
MLRRVGRLQRRWVCEALGRCRAYKLIHTQPQLKNHRGPQCELLI